MKHRFYYENGLLLIPAVIGGREKKELHVILAVDTGSFYSNFKPSVLKSVGAFFTKERILLLGVGERVESEFAILNSFTCLGISTQNFLVTSHALPDNYPIDGLLGNDFFRQYKIGIDFPNGIISIE